MQEIFDWSWKLWWRSLTTPERVGMLFVGGVIVGGVLLAAFLLVAYNLT